MDTNFLKYRKRHRRCKYCRYYKLVIPHAYGVIPFDKCIVKDREVSYPNDFPRVFCRYYTVDESGGITE